MGPRGPITRRFTLLVGADQTVITGLSAKEGKNAVWVGMGPARAGEKSLIVREILALELRGGNNAIQRLWFQRALE